MSNNVKFIRKSKDFDLTQDELARAIGVSRATISAIENGALPSLDVAYKISVFLKKPIEEIFFEDSVA